MNEIGDFKILQAIAAPPNQWAIIEDDYGPRAEKIDFYGLAEHVYDTDRDGLPMTETLFGPMLSDSSADGSLVLGLSLSNAFTIYEGLTPEYELARTYPDMVAFMAQPSRGSEAVAQLILDMLPEAEFSDDGQLANGVTAYAINKRTGIAVETIVQMLKRSGVVYEDPENKWTGRVARVAA